MKKLKKIFIFLIIFILLFACSAYIDYYIVKTKNTIPRISVKKEINDNLIVYNALMYRVWYCKINGKYTIGDYKDSDAVCFSKDSYDEEGNYTNNENVLIKKEEINLLSNYYTSGQISTMTKEDLDNALFTIFEFGKIKYKKIGTKEDTTKNVTQQTKDTTKNTTSQTKDTTKSTTSASTTDATKNKQQTQTQKITYDIVVFGEYKLNDKNEYTIVYNDKVQYCLNSNKEIALYENNVCSKTFTKIKFDNKLCSNYKDTGLKKETLLTNLCKE